MAPAADFAFSDEAIGSTFLLSNAVPQRQSVNSGRWRQLENAVRRLASASGSAIIFTGPIFESSAPEFIGQGRVAVPSHTFKVVLLIQGQRKTMLAAIIPNQSGIRQPLDDFSVSVDGVDSRTGLDFFSALDDLDQNALESLRASWFSPGPASPVTRSRKIINPAPSITSLSN